MEIAVKIKKKKKPTVAYRYKTKRRQQQELGSLVNTNAARRVAVRVLVHPDEQLRGVATALGGDPLSSGASTSIHSNKQVLAANNGFPYYCLPYHPLLCAPAALHQQQQQQQQMQHSSSATVTAPEDRSVNHPEISVD